MDSIVFDINELKSLKNNIEKTNNDILFEIKNMQREVDNMHEILDTPKGKKYQALFGQYVIDEIKMVSENGNIINHDLEKALDEYNAFMEKVREMVDNNG